jgi:hypothetical protein
MRANANIIILVCLLFLVGTAGAAWDVDTVTVTTDKLWVLANNEDRSTITISVMNTSPDFGGGLAGISLKLAVDPVYGTLSPDTVITDSSGTARSTFTVRNRSGIAQITATTSSPARTGFTYQSIDHDIYLSPPAYSPMSGVAGEEVQFSLSFTDRWGNPVDNRRPDDAVSLSLSCPLPNDCGFYGTDHSYVNNLDSNGNLQIPLQLGTKTGVTAIVMSPFEGLGQHEFFIDTLPSSPVLKAAVTPAVEPPYTIPTVPVNSGEFTFVYTLADTYGNPAPNQLILITTSLGEEQLTKTNTLGQTPIQTYGPKSTVGTVDITATVLNSTPLLTNQFSVAFAHTEPQDMTFVVSPQSMKSLELDPASHATAVVQVLDNFGNPVSGEDVTFAIPPASISYAPGSVASAPPVLTSTGGKTDEYGRVTTVFKPGAFSSTGPSDGSCQLTAVWGSTSRSATMSWSNRAYLNINTTVYPPTVKVNDTIDVTIEVSVNGDRPNYRDVSLMFIQDSSGSMSEMNTTLNPNQNQVDQSTNAMITFINGALVETDDRIGLRVFGSKKEEYLPIGSAYSLVVTALDGLKPTASPGDLGPSLVAGIEDLKTATAPPSERQKDVKVLILMSGGNSNLDSNKDYLTAIVQNANANNVTIYPIAFADGDTCNACTQFRVLAEGTNGTVHYADTVDELAAAFADIAEAIRILADTDTTMDVSFKNVVINNTAYAGSDVFDYVPVGPFVPLQTIQNPDGRTSIVWPNASQSVVDQTDQWDTPDHNLQFYVGAIDIKQKWTATFRLKVKKAGTYNIFSPGSQIVLNGKSVMLPEAPVTVLQDNPQQGILTGSLRVENLHELNAPAAGYYTDFVSLQWNTKYTSLTATNLVKESVYYRYNGGPWKQFDTKTVQTGDSTQSTTLDVRKLPSGTYDIRVHASPVAGDATDADSATLSITVKRQSDTPYLNLS